jgi:hypothetical protein
MPTNPNHLHRSRAPQLDDSGTCHLRLLSDLHLEKPAQAKSRGVGTTGESVLSFGQRKSQYR